jgi:hypothetical protein
VSVLAEAHAQPHRADRLGGHGLDHGGTLGRERRRRERGL